MLKILKLVIIYLTLNGEVDLALFCTGFADTTLSTLSAPIIVPESLILSARLHQRSCGLSIYSYDKYPEFRIVGGSEVKPNEYPSIVSMVSSTNGVCGGTILSENYILSAAHCFDDSPKYVDVYFGDHSWTDEDMEEFKIRVFKYKIHPKYNFATNDYDFALLRLTNSLDFSDSWRWQKACLPTNCDDGTCQEGDTAFIVGWGDLHENGSSPDILNHAMTVIANTDICKKQYQDYVFSVTDRMICSGFDAGGIDTCQGDSGGPLYTIEDGRHFLCGVTSWAKGCARPNYYGVSGKVCSVIDWIKKHSDVK